MSCRRKYEWAKDPNPHRPSESRFCIHESCLRSPARIGLTDCIVCLDLVRTRNRGFLNPIAPALSRFLDNRTKKTFPRTPRFRWTSGLLWACDARAFPGEAQRDEKKREPFLGWMGIVSRTRARTASVRKSGRSTSQSCRHHTSPNVIARPGPKSVSMTIEHVRENT
jgi:hypothetical protein